MIEKCRYLLIEEFGTLFCDKSKLPISDDDCIKCKYWKS